MPPNVPAPPTTNAKRGGAWPWLLPPLILLAVLLMAPAPESNTMAFSEWRTRVAAGTVKTASIAKSGAVTGTLTDGKKYTTRIPVAVSDDALIGDLVGHGVTVKGVDDATNWAQVVLGLLPMVGLLVLFWWLLRRAAGGLGGGGVGGMRSVGRSKAKVYDEERPGTLFADVAGYEGAKQEIAEVVDFLKRPERYKAAGATGPRGVLMVGPPGTGKTLLARAVAGEADVPFFVVTGSSFVEMFVGVGAARVRDLFAEARKRAPSIVFLDEIDAIGQRRGAHVLNNDEREQTLNQLLAELDGFDRFSGVVVLAATNRPDVLDPALLRPGRFDRQVEIPLPNLKERLAILGVHARSKKLSDAVDLEVTARGTPGFSGADLANLLNEAAICAVRAEREVIEPADLEEARDRVLLGRRDASGVLLPAEKRAVAIHEAGHAVVAALSPHADPVAKVTILPSGRALGATEQLPVDERHLYPESYLRDSLAVRLGGRAAELLILGERSTGAADDLAGATALATRMVREFGMSARFGPVSFATDAPAYLGDEPVVRRPYAEHTQRVVDEEVASLVAAAAEQADAVLRAHQAGLLRVVEDLMAHETISGDAVASALAGPGAAGAGTGADSHRRILIGT